MKIHQMFETGRPVLSFEVFPPKRDGDISSIYKTIEDLAQVGPDYISVTYGAAGSERGNETLHIASTIKREYGIEALAHLTGVKADEAEIGKILDLYNAYDIQNILALRGDLDTHDLNDINGTPSNGRFKYASELIAHIKKTDRFSIGAACYPEQHIEARSRTTDLIHLKEKVDAGADFLVTQLFFDNEKFYDFRNEARSLDIDVPITVGIMPVLARKQIERIVALSGAYLPEKFKKILVKYEHKPAVLQDAGIAYACEQIVDLLSSGVDGIHIYVMNKPEVARRILDNIGGIMKAELWK